MRFALALLLLLPALAQEIIPLRPGETPDPKIPPEKIEERGKNGVIDRSITNVSVPTVTVYLPPASRATGTGIVVAPGGGYQHLAIDKEGHDIARWLNTLGIAALVLKYRLPGGGATRAAGEDVQAEAQAIHIALEDAESAVALARHNAAEWHLKTNKIGFMGFSAGGHLGAMIGMVAPPDTRPDFLVLGYPAVPKVLDVNSSTPPTFLVAAEDDTTVNCVDNAARFFAALRAAKVPAELHLYSSGGHGFGIVKSGKTSAEWPHVFAAWLKQQGYE